MIAVPANNDYIVFIFCTFYLLFAEYLGLCLVRRMISGTHAFQVSEVLRACCVVWFFLADARICLATRGNSVLIRYDC